jgi:hypothetical protein
MSVHKNHCRYYHLRIGGGVITAFTQRCLVYNKTTMGLSLCSPKDQFKKETGRTIAFGRFHRKPITVDHEGHTFTDVKKYVIDNTDAFPSWVRNNINEIRM